MSRAHGAPQRRKPAAAPQRPAVSAPKPRKCSRGCKALNPKPETELEYRSPYELLVAVTLSAQATDVGVNKATRKLFPVANTPQAIAALGVDGLKPYIATIGLYNTKAANVVAMAQQLIEHHGGEVPRDRAALEALPGVGRKTANVVLNTAFGEADHGRRHPHLPRRQPHRAGPGQDRARGRGRACSRRCPRTTCTTRTTG